ncbi:MAG: BlaI/MecI/CopY family transcriptional regulator [Actinobacteria bacterium]|nr:BlaI/MecI/CopY family transcriptional regulator [Actinomycetota bacterium]
MGRRSKRIAINGFSELEASIMNLVWKSNKISVREIHEILVKKEYLPYTTVMVTMTNLANRGILKQDKSGKTYYYSAKISRLDAAEAMIHGVIETVLQGSPEEVNELLKRFR